MVLVIALNATRACNHESFSFLTMHVSPLSAVTRARKTERWSIAGLGIVEGTNDNITTNGIVMM